MKYDIVTIGDAFEDIFVKPEVEAHYNRNFTSGKCISFELGQKVPLDSVLYEIGGSACNAAVGLSRLGYKVSIVTMLGDDTPKARILERLDSENVDASNIIINKKTQTGFSVIFRVEDNRTIFVYHGVKDYSDINIRKSLKTRWYFITPLGDNTGMIERRMIAEVSENGAKLAWNPGTKQIERGATELEPLLKATTVLFLNKEEGIKFVNLPVRPNMEHLLRKLYAYGPKIVIITDGPNGAYAYDGKQVYFRDSDKRIRPIDVTGAGDSFATGVLGRLINTDWSTGLEAIDIEEALEWGHKNSSSVIRQVGGQPGLLDRKSI